MKKNVNLQALRDANKECKTLSGVCKIIATFWGSGYRQAFSQFGISYDQLKKDVPSIIALAQKNNEGDIFVSVRKAQKDKDGNFVKDKDGKRVYITIDKVVTAWTPSTLYRVLEQSMNK